MRRGFESRVHAVRPPIASAVVAITLGLSLNARVAWAQQTPLVAPWDLPAAPAVCAPGAISRCPCAGGATGMRQCLGVGMSWGVCACGSMRSSLPGEVESPGDRDPARREGDRPATARRWYGWQFLIVDGLSLVLAVSTIGTGSPAQFAVATTGFSLGAPIIHWAHGHVGRGFGSLGMRIGMPAVALGISVAVGRGYSSLLVGAVLVPTAIAAAVTIDAAVLAYDDAPTPSTRGSFAWAPTLDLRPEGALLGVAGSF